MLATLTGFGAFTEIAMLGDTHAAFLVGGPTVGGTSLLMTAARLLALLAVGLGVTTMPIGRPRGSTRWILSVTVLTFTAWTAHWRLLPLL